MHSKKKLIFFLTFLFLAALSVTSACSGNDENESRRIEEKTRFADSLMNEGRYQEAMNEYIGILKETDKTDNDTLAAKALSKLGTIYAYHDDYRKAVAYYQKSLNLSRLRHDSIGLFMTVSNLVMLNKALGEKDEETKYVKMFKELNLTGSVEYNYRYLYIDFLDALEKGEDLKSEELLKQMEAFIDENNYGDSNKAILYNHLGMRKMQCKKFDNALSFYRSAAAILDTTSLHSNLQGVYSNMCELFQTLGEKDSLTFYRGKMVESTDSIFNLRSFSDVKEKLDLYEEAIASNEMKTLRNRIFWISCIMILLVSILVLILLYSRKINEARLIMVRRNESLLNENHALQRQIEVITRKRESVMENIDVTTPSENVNAEDNEDSQDNRQYPNEESNKKHGLSEDKMEQISSEILALMNDNKTVYNPEYNISMMALTLNTNTRYVSEAIRQLGYSNFRNFINEFRVREACRRLSDTDTYGKLTIAAIAEDVGFNSDNSFILAFKKVMGITPAKYRRLATEVQNSESNDETAND